jgi:hypothetical protein
LDGEDQLGHWVYEQGSVGDVIGFLLWPNASGVLLPGGPTPRSIPAWAAAFPSQLVSVASGASTASAAANALPILNEGWRTDPRFVELGVSPHPELIVPCGTVGIVLQGTKEDSQEELFFPCDNRLVAVNWAGDPSFSSRVYDLDDENCFDADRWAHLHSMMRVMRTLPGKFPFDPDFNALAWQLGASGKGDPDEGWGLVVENVGGIPVAAVASTKLAGPLSAGFVQDKHQGAVDKDGIPYNSLHIGLNAYYVSEGQVGLLVGPGLPPILTEVDGPEEFDPNVYSRPTGGPVRLPVFKRWDPQEPHDFLGEVRDGKLRWEVDGWIYTPDPLGGDVEDPRPPFDEPRQEPPIKQWKAYDRGKGDYLKEKEVYGATPAPIISNGTIHRGAMVDVEGQSDTRGIPVIDDAWLNRMDREAPAVMRTESLPCTTGGGVNYTEDPKHSRYMGGTSDGAVIDGPPEMDAKDFKDMTLPGALDNVSTATRAIYPGAELGFGPYDTEICNISDGHKIVPDTTNDGTTDVVAVDENGTETTIVTYTQTGVTLLLDDQPLLGYEEHFPTPPGWVTSAYQVADTTDAEYICTYKQNVDQSYTIKGKVPQRHAPTPVDTSEWQLGINVEWWASSAGNVDWLPKILIFRCGQLVNSLTPQNTTNTTEQETSTANTLMCDTWYIGSNFIYYPVPGDTWYLILERTATNSGELAADTPLVNVYAQWEKRSDTAEWNAIFPAPGSPAAGTATGASIPVTWTDNATGETGYEMQISETSASGPWTDVETIAADSSSYTYLSLDPSTQHWCRWRATGAAGDGDWSDVVTATTTAGDSGYALGSIGAITISSTEIDVGWTNPVNNIDLVIVERSLSASGPWTTLSGGVAVATEVYNDTGLTPSTTYYYRCRGVNTAKTEGGAWSEDNATTSA